MRFRVPLALSCALTAGFGAAPVALASHPVGQQCKTLGGPCRSVATVGALLRPPGAAREAGGSDLVVASNFGMLLTADEGKSWQFVCEETFGRGALDRVQLHPDGRLIAPGGDGVYSSAGGCGFVAARGSVAGRYIWDVAVDPAAPAHVFALSTEPRALHESTDGGRTFTEKHRFADRLRLHRVLLSATNPRRVYVAGYGERVAMAIAVSDDGGTTFTIDESGSGFTDPSRAVDFLAVDPRAADTLFIAVADANTGDEIWRSDDGGKRFTKLLTLRLAELKTGFAFGSGETLYVAGRAPFETPDSPTAHLYTSHDGGKSWDVLPSGVKGPRYRCLAYEKDKLYACADDEPGLDPFLLGASINDGKTWEPLVRLAQVKGAKACAAETCATTAVWLCEAHGACGPSEGRPSRDADAAVSQTRDGGAAADASKAPALEGDGCGCRIAGDGSRAAAASGLAALLPMILVGALLRRRSR